MFLRNILLCLFSLSAIQIANALPTGFSIVDVTAANTVNEGIAMGHAPDGRIFIAQRDGTIKVVKGSTITTVHKITTTIDREQGLLKLILHPKFAENGWVYVYYMNQGANRHFVDRLTFDAQNKVTKTENLIQLPLLTNGGRHNGGGLTFGKDGLLYVSRGEDETSTWADNLDTQRGKVLRFTENGLPAPGNPYAIATNAEQKTIWAVGFRNPWVLTTDPLTGKIYEVDVGLSYEEINEVSAPDASKKWFYGWGDQSKDGAFQDSLTTITPYYTYRTGSIGCAIINAVPFNPPVTSWPAQYKNLLFFSDYCQPWIRTIDMANPKAEPVIFHTSLTSAAMGMSVGIDGNIYFLHYNGGGRLSKIVSGNAPVYSREIVRASGLYVTQGILHWSSPYGINQTELKIFDSLGRVVHAATLDGMVGQSALSLSPGVYVYRLMPTKNGTGFQGSLMVD